LAAVVSLLALGCATGADGALGDSSGAVPIVIPRPSFTLMATDGAPYDFAARTAGKFTFVEFGYTNCPDVCPIHLANLSAVLANLTPTERARTAVVFISVDPDRDSLAALRQYVGAFDKSFVGLRGTQDEVNAILAKFNFGPAMITTDSTGATFVSHASPVVLFTPNDTAHAMYPFGTRQADWARDLARLLKEYPAAAPTASVSRAYVVAAAAAPSAVYFELESSVPDTIVALTVDGFGSAMLHETSLSAATASMAMRDRIPVPAGITRFAPGGLHGMVSGSAERSMPSRGSAIGVTVVLARGGAIRAQGNVIAFTDVDTATALRGSARR